MHQNSPFFRSKINLKILGRGTRPRIAGDPASLPDHFKHWVNFTFTFTQRPQTAAKAQKMHLSRNVTNSLKQAVQKTATICPRPPAN